MKAFTRYPKGQTDLYILLESLKKYGRINCDFDTFNRIHSEWHLRTFPGCPVNTNTANFRPDWFSSFVEFISKYDIDDREVDDSYEPVQRRGFIWRLLHRSSV